MTELQFTPICSPDELHGFDCGNASINALVEKSYPQQLTKQARTYRVLYRGCRVGFYSVSIATVTSENEPSALADYYEGNEPHFGAVKLDFIAIEKSFQRYGLGKKLLEHVAGQVRELSRNWPVRILYLDALSDKVDWYKTNGFQLFAEDQSGAGYTVPMYLDLLTADEERALHLFAEDI